MENDIVKIYKTPNCNFWDLVDNINIKQGYNFFSDVQEYSVKIPGWNPELTDFEVFHIEQIVGINHIKPPAQGFSRCFIFLEKGLASRLLFKYIRGNPIAYHVNGVLHSLHQVLDVKPLKKLKRKNGLIIDDSVDCEYTNEFEKNHPDTINFFIDFENNGEF